MKTKRGLSRACRISTGAAAAAMLVGFVAERDARAGCNDGACGRIDWTEVTDTDQGTPAAAKLHGGYSWEASPDLWATHPVIDKFPGYFWLTCRPPGGAADPTCKQALATEMAKAGSNTTIVFGGTYFVDGGPVQPRGLFREGQAGQAVLYGTDVQFGANPMNPQTCASALAVPRNDPDGGTAGAGGGAGAGGSSTDDAGGSADADLGADTRAAGGNGGNGGAAGNGGSGTTGGAGADTTGSAGSAAPPAPAADDGGCNVAHRRSRGDARVVGLALIAAAFGIGRRSRKRG
jgi:hypothetical protein